MAMKSERTTRSEDGRTRDPLGGYEGGDVEVNSFSAEEELPAGDRIERFLRQLGAGDKVVDLVKRRSADVDVRQVVARFKRFAQENPAVILGALSAVILGGAVAAERAVSRSRSSKRAAASKSARARKTGGSKTASASRKSAGSSKKAAAKSTSSKKSSSAKGRSASKGTRRAASKRTMIEPHEGDKRYVRRDAAGHFKKEVNVGRSLAADRRSKSTTAVKKGQGDRGDVRR